MNENKSMNDNEIAIVGGAGFVGSRLANRFKKQNISFNVYDIDCSDKLNKTIYLDIENVATLDQLKKTSIIINLAAVHRDDVRPLSRYDDVNIQGSINICNVARKYNINKIIFTSSVAIYGFASADTNESGMPNYFNDYGRTKYFAEQVFKDWQMEDSKKRTLVIVRPTVIFGEGNRGNVYNLLKQLASDRFIMFGNGKNRKSMAYVENVAAFLEYSLSFNRGIHIYNYVDKPDFDMNALVSMTKKTLFGKNNVGLRLPAFIGTILGHLVDILAKITGKSLSVSGIRIKKFMATTQFSSSVSKTNFIAPISLEEGLVKTINYEFLEDNLDKRTFNTE